ncbi:phage tail sheath C-terminal domain-containing protein [Myxacorys almedinensis]|uniref:Phage tail protein n=1 Tax=Myxacorys almedinensis A TaxID=2690445 RepID=A0A8J8CKV7_9CYAN|nr:phage tail sheath C-terminal domain-containing protein [Myxacorys almedinensis]NDJ18996.1 phage tail protein [Myxacorys almedinensis A]
MPELILPGVFIEVRAEALIVAGSITVSNIGIVGTAKRGPVGEVTILGSYAEARETFGSYDPFENPDTANNPLTLVRALELAYANGATTVFAVRVTGTEDTGDPENSVAAWGKFSKARKAFHNVASAGGIATILRAKNPGVWGNEMTISVTDAAPNVTVTLKYSAIEETYTVKDGKELLEKINAPNTGSLLVSATEGNQPTQAPGVTTETAFTGGVNSNDANDTDYGLGLDQLQNENAHIILAAGRDGAAINSRLQSHVETASTDKIRRDRIAVTGSALGATVPQILANTPSSDRTIFVAPGIKTSDSANAGKEVTLSGAYAAAAVAGAISARDAHISLTNKTISVNALETKFTPAQLEQLVTGRILALEQRQGFRIVKGITTDDGAFRQITTRRIVDFAKFGVRSASSPYIGLLNNDRVRKALKGSINGFLAGMVDDEMLISYELDVTATREEEIRGIAKVILTLRPTFSIDFIKVTMFLG